MRIAIDIRRIEDFGVGTYIQNLVLTLASRDHDNNYLLLGDPKKVSAVTSLPENFRVLEWGDLRESWWRHVKLHQLLQASGVDLFHIPHLGMAPLVPCRYLMTVHDLADFLYGLAPGLKQSMKFRLARRSLARAERIVAVSQATKQDIENLFAIPSQKITVVENAIDERFIQSSRRDESLLVLERYQVTDPFLLYVGSARPQKNIPRLKIGRASCRERVYVLV